MNRIHHYVRHLIIDGIDLFYKPFKKKIPLKTFRYIACGGSNAAFDIFLFALSYNFILKKENLDLGIVTLSPHIAAFAMVFPISTCTGYYLNRYVVFQRSGLSRRVQLSRFIMVSITSVFLNYLFLKIFVDYLHFYPTISKIISTVLIALISYLSQTYFYFREKTETVNEKI